MRQMPDLQNLQNCSDLTDGEINEKSTFSFAKDPIATLQFNGTEGLTWQNFERLCCRLMGKLFNLRDCRRYARGRNQHGIDIIGYRSASPDSLVVIQCKQHDDFDLSTFNRAVQEFKQGSFYGKASEFIILASCQLLPATVEQEAYKFRRELLTNQCVFEIWNGEKISQELKRFPEIVEAFYRQDVVRAFCQPWEIRQRLIEMMAKSYQDRGDLPLPDNIVPNQEQEEVARSLEEKQVYIWHYEPFLSYVDAFLRIDSFLPKQHNYYGSCLITFKQADLHGGFFS